MPETPSPFNRNIWIAPPDYSPDASILRNKVYQVGPELDPDKNPYIQRDYPDSNRLAQHCRIAEATFATLGTGPNQYPDPALDNDLLYAVAIATNGWPQEWLCTPSPKTSDYVCDAGKVIKDVAADTTPGLSTLAVGQIFHSHWRGVENGAVDRLILTADRGIANSWALAAPVVTSMIAAAASGDDAALRNYASFISNVHRRLTGGV